MTKGRKSRRPSGQPDTHTIPELFQAVPVSTVAGPSAHMALVSHSPSRTVDAGRASPDLCENPSSPSEASDSGPSPEHPTPPLSAGSPTAVAPLLPAVLDSALREELRALLHSLATKDDIDKMAQRVEGTLRREIEVVQQEVTHLSGRVSDVETSHTSLAARVSALESGAMAQAREYALMQLKIDDCENRSRRNNLRLRGIPESTAGPELRITVLAILNKLLHRNPEEPLEMDRVHRTAGPRRSDRDSPRDVLCRIHFFVQKEDIIRRAWLQKSVDFDGAVITILPDLSRHTLYLRRLLRPLLSLITASGATYRWGHPFHIQVLKDQALFSLQTPEQLPEMFAFLGADPIAIPDWLATRELPQPPARSAPRPQRSRSRRPRLRESGHRPPNPPVEPTSRED